MRNREPLGGTNGFAENAIPQLCLECWPGHEIDRNAKDLAKEALQARKLEKRGRLVEVDEQIHVALVGGLVPRDRAEQEECLHVERP